MDDGLDPPSWVSGSASSMPPDEGSAPRRRPPGPPPAPEPPRSRPRRPVERRPSLEPRPRRRPPPGPTRREVQQARRRTPDPQPDLRDEPDDDYDDLGEEDDEHGTSRRGRAAAVDAAKAHRRRHRRRNLAALAIVLVIIVPVVTFLAWFVYQLNPPGGPGDTIEGGVEIPGDASLSHIGDILAGESVIGSSWAFQFYGKVTGSGPFESGTYEFQTDMGVRDAMKRLDAGPPQPTGDIELTIPPGMTLEQTAQIVGELPDRDADTFLQLAQAGAVQSRYRPEGGSLEGLVFPDTYLIGPQEDETAILQKLVNQFDLVADRVGLANSAATNGRTPYETVIIASMIEREAGVEADRPLISAVIRNRIDQGMLLQIDAVNCYAKPGGCAENPLTDADKQQDTPYNTYLYPGLPPTPISGVTEAALQAALNPTADTFLFYVIGDESGAHVFANTLDEHNANVAAAQDKGLL